MGTLCLNRQAKSNTSRPIYSLETLFIEYQQAYLKPGNTKECQVQSDERGGQLWSYVCGVFAFKILLNF